MCILSGFIYFNIRITVFTLKHMLLNPDYSVSKNKLSPQLYLSAKISCDLFLWSPFLRQYTVQYR